MIGPFQLRVTRVEANYHEHPVTYTSTLRSDDGALHVTIETPEPLALGGRFEIANIE